MKVPTPAGIVGAGVGVGEGVGEEVGVGDGAGVPLVGGGPGELSPDPPHADSRQAAAPASNIAADLDCLTGIFCPSSNDP
ncbi:hypothetical protein K3172_04470 [Qipengyuania sp. 6B39]|uniref:hypothetical protein n=1 Tax=Qipengyuania proteolytica TaxID=2867239 RepID=UPI001C8AAEE6|nr:hypothetical protein [Qipengyuania proteolytica]MBX7495110.1 hypothetical protein [Qipengyuania proteolytica]